MEKDKNKISLSKENTMKKILNVCITISLLFFVSCYYFKHIDYSLIESNKLKSYIPSFHTEGYINHGASKLYISYNLYSHDSIKVLKLIPILNVTDTMTLESVRFISELQRYIYMYNFKYSESIMKSKGFELLIDVLLYKNGISERYTDTIYVKEEKRHYRNWGDDLIPNIGH